MERIERIADAIEQRAFLYDDPASFRAGVQEAVRALELLIGASDQRTELEPALTA